MISAFSSSALARKDERYGPSRDLTSPYSSNALRAGNVAPRVPDTAALAGLLSRGAGLPGVTPHQRIVLGLRRGHSRSLAPASFSRHRLALVYSGSEVPGQSRGVFRLLKSARKTPSKECPVEVRYAPFAVEVCEVEAVHGGCTPTPAMTSPRLFKLATKCPRGIQRFGPVAITVGCAWHPVG